MNIQINKLHNYCKSMLLDFSIEGDILMFNSLQYLILDQSIVIVDDEGDFSPITDLQVDGFVYEFGGRWYLQTKNEELEMTELAYIGIANEKVITKSFLGIRSGYELMNGMGLYKDWIAKGKFLGVEALAICERNTLSGVLSFQNACVQNDIKPIIGMTISLSGSDIKLYAQNFQGWLNLLKFNEVINVKQEMFITQEQLRANIEGLILVVDPKSMAFVDTKEIKDLVNYYQLDTVNFTNGDRDFDYMNNLEDYIKSELKPISITDAFYLEADDYRTREALWTINKAFDDKTNNQFFKSKTQYARELVQMFDSEDKSWIQLYKDAVANESELVDLCDFKYDTDTRHLPKYVMTAEESASHDTNEKLFMSIIKKGFKDRNITDANKYVERLKKEIAVLKMGDVIDYFLSLHDIINYAKSKKMLTGIGRGSAGGSLVAYLMGIIQVDPLRFDLLFERFLNSGRMGNFEERPSFIVEADGQTIEFEEGSLVRIKRNEKETVVFIQELVEGDEILNY
tara:strand:+ start:310 stop:1848 length:1539 start_codon:yes stop_codon:yes gene_type:complete